MWWYHPDDELETLERTFKRCLETYNEEWEKGVENDWGEVRYDEMRQEFEEARRRWKKAQDRLYALAEKYGMRKCVGKRFTFPEKWRWGKQSLWQCWRVRQEVKDEKRIWKEAQELIVELAKKEEDLIDALYELSEYLRGSEVEVKALERKLEEAKKKIVERGGVKYYVREEARKMPSFDELLEELKTKQLTRDTLNLLLGVINSKYSYPDGCKPPSCQNVSSLL